MSPINTVKDLREQLNIYPDLTEEIYGPVENKNEKTVLLKCSYDDQTGILCIEARASDYKPTSRQQLQAISNAIYQIPDETVVKFSDLVLKLPAFHSQPHWVDPA